MPSDVVAVVTNRERLLKSQIVGGICVQLNCMLTVSVTLASVLQRAWLVNDQLTTCQHIILNYSSLQSQL